MRVKRGIKARRRRNEVLKLAKGFRGRSSTTIRQGTQRAEKALTYAYRDRRVRKRDFRRLWIARISAAAKSCGISYSQLMNGLKVANVSLNRKTLAELGVRDMEGFKSVVSVAKLALQSNA